MKKLVVGEPGQWMRSNGEIVEIESMIDPHLHNALRIVDNKLREATATMVRVESLQRIYKTEDDPQAIATLAEIKRLREALTLKKQELESEIGERAIRDE